MQTRHDDNTDRLTQATSCEMIQEIYGLGSYYLLREDEEKVFQRLMSKYRRTDYGVSEIDSPKAKDEQRLLGLLIRKALAHRKSELTTATREELPRKESVLSAAAGSSSGTVGKAAGDSETARRRIGLG
jgi:hypothetical protein